MSSRQNKAVTIHPVARSRWIDFQVFRPQGIGHGCCPIGNPGCPELAFVRLRYLMYEGCSLLIDRFYQTMVVPPNLGFLPLLHLSLYVIQKLISIAMKRNSQLSAVETFFLLNLFNFSGVTSAPSGSTIFIPSIWCRIPPRKAVKYSSRRTFVRGSQPQSILLFFLVGKFIDSS